MDKPNQFNLWNRKIEINNDMKLLILFLLIFIILIIWLMKYFKNSIQQGNTDSLSKKFIKFFNPNNDNNNNSNSDNNNNYYSISFNDQDKEKDMKRLINQYCKNSQNCFLKSKNPLNISYRKNFKFDFNINYEYISIINGKKSKTDCLLTIFPLNNSLISLEDSNLIDSFIKFLNDIFEKNKKYLVNNFNLDILYNQKLLIKISQIYKFGSLKDLIYSTNPLYSYEKKNIIYNKNQIGKPLSKKKISKFSRQILLLLKRLHKNNIYHLNLHSGNILVDNDNNIKVNDLEMVILSDLKRQDENFFSYLFEYYSSNPKGNLLNIFEVIDIISFGKILYEISTGSEMKNAELNIKKIENIDKDIIDILKLIFPKDNICSVSIKQILKMNLVKNNFIDDDSDNNEMNDDDDDNFIIVHYDDDSDSEKDNENSSLISSNNNYSNIKNILFNEKQFIEKIQKNYEINTSK